MVYVALLRGINVGGNNIVDMKRLKTVFENAGMTSVKTYINSGNVIFSTKARGQAPLVRRLEEAIAEHFGFKVSLLLRDLTRMRSLVKAIPKQWIDGAEMRCYVMFLWDDVDRPAVVRDLQVKPEIDDARYAAGAVIWRVDRENINRSGMAKLTGTTLYRRMTIRNCNTARKLLQLMESAS